MVLHDGRAEGFAESQRQGEREGSRSSMASAVCQRNARAEAHARAKSSSKGRAENRWRWRQCRHGHYRFPCRRRKQSEGKNLEGLSLLPSALCRRSRRTIGGWLNADAGRSVQPQAKLEATNKARLPIHAR